MPFYRRKIFVVPIFIVATFLIWQDYMFSTMTFRPDPSLTEPAEAAFEFMTQNDIGRVLIKNGKAETFELDGWRWRPVELRERLPMSIIESIEESNINIDHVSFERLCRSRCYLNAVFYINRPFEAAFLPIYTPWWYLQYAPSGGVEAEVVPSIEDAIKERRDANNLQNGYFFCEPSELEHWYLCTGLHAS
ncbi:hypothetical protein [Vreelandella stevensii]|uniref:hypothetical protein n=1 Tax=Vreelandella stevensii TaxID=502821 RepID=UPI003749CA21